MSGENDLRQLPLRYKGTREEEKEEIYLKLTYYHSANLVRLIKFRRLRWTGHVARMEKNSGVFKISVPKSAGKKCLGWPRCRWKEYIRMTLKEIGVNTRKWSGIIGYSLWMRNWIFGFHKPRSVIIPSAYHIFINRDISLLVY